MLTIRPFKNTDPANILFIWSHNANSNPNKYIPLQSDVLESQIFGNSLFDPDGFLLALDGEQPVGFVHASFGPDKTGALLDHTSGVIFSPVVIRSLSNVEEIVEALVLKAEEYLVNKGATHWFVGGLGKDSPFYTGMYGRANPFGLFSDDFLMIELFERLGYKNFRRSIQLTLNVMKYQAPINDTILKTHRQTEVRRNATWAARNWWDANIYRNFNSYEWNVFARDDNSGRIPEPIAGAVIHQMLLPSVFAAKRYCILSFIGVLQTSLRHGIGSVLFSSLVNDLQYECFIPTTMEASIPAENETLVDFLRYHSFREVGGYVSMCKGTGLNGAKKC